MDRIDRRKFLTGSAAAAASAYGASAAANEADQGDVARSRQRLLDDPIDNDPLGLSGGDLTPEAVRKSLEAGVRYLKSQQLKDGTWPDRPHYDGGLTPLATLALLHAGCPPDDYVVDKALAYLRDYTARTTYTMSLQTMVLCAVGAKSDLAHIARNVRSLEERQWQEGESIGMWSIAARGSTDHTDNSMTHFAMLALYEAERAGITVRDRTWQLAFDHWRRTQSEHGCWGWGPKYPGTGSMTCAGIAALLVAANRLQTADAVVEGDQIVGCRLQTQLPELEAALDWLARWFSVRRNLGTEYWYSYYMYALERAGRMLAERFIGNHDWYREGARALVASQEFSGAWPPDVEFQEVSDSNVSTSFSLMFLAKGRWPVVVAQLKHPPLDDWNRHRAALPNLMSHLGKAWQRDLTHQVVDIGRASVDDLLQSPVLYLSGREAPQFTDAEKKKLREYLDRGGFLFAERCCGGDGFDIAFRRLMRDIFPESDFQLHPLPPDHPVWYAQEPVDLAALPELWGVDASCRTAVIYSPNDLSSHWELDPLGREPAVSPTALAKIRAARRIGLNVLTYATGREVEFKDPSLPVVATGGVAAAVERGKIHIANVLHLGGCNAAPASLGNLLRHASDDFQIDVARTLHEVRLSDPDLYRYHLLIFHGRNEFELAPIEREMLREYVARGGTVLADAICSSKPFTTAFRREMREIFPASPLERIPANDPIFTPAYGGADLGTVTRRRAKSLLAGRVGASASFETEPTLEAVTVDGRYAVVFSPYDISCGLETEPMGCEGYSRRDAVLLAINVLLYSLNH